MHGFFGYNCICILTLLATATGFPQTAAVSGANSDLRIIVRIYDYANLSPETLLQAKQEAGRIFHLQSSPRVWRRRT
jgi:hypothetical protein